MRRYAALVIVLFVAVAGVATLVRARSAPKIAQATTAPDGAGGGEGLEEGGDPDASAENHAGTVRVRNRVLDPSALAATGWAGEVQIANDDTWEPYVAADPSAPYVYALYNRYGITCQHCPNPQMQVRISSDGGQTWAPEKPICTCSGV